MTYFGKFVCAIYITSLQVNRSYDFLILLFNWNKKFLGNKRQEGFNFSYISGSDAVYYFSLLIVWYLLNNSIITITLMMQ